MSILPGWVAQTVCWHVKKKAERWQNVNQDVGLTNVDTPFWGHAAAAWGSPPTGWLCQSGWRGRCCWGTQNTMLLQLKKDSFITFLLSSASQPSTWLAWANANANVFNWQACEMGLKVPYFYFWCLQENVYMVYCSTCFFHAVHCCSTSIHPGGGTNIGTALFVYCSVELNSPWPNIWTSNTVVKFMLQCSYFQTACFNVIRQKL